MPQRSRITQLPAKVRAELEKRLIANGFSGYIQLAEWLGAQGYAISKSAVHAHGQKLDRRINQIGAATAAAQALLAGAPDDEQALPEAALRLAQGKLFELLLAAEEDDPRMLSQASRAVAELARTHGAVLKNRRDTLAAAAATAERAAVKQGLSKDAAMRIRQEIEAAA